MGFEDEGGVAEVPEGARLVEVLVCGPNFVSRRERRVNGEGGWRKGGGLPVDCAAEVDHGCECEKSLA